MSQYFSLGHCAGFRYPNEVRTRSFLLLFSMLFASVADASLGLSSSEEFLQSGDPGCLHMVQGRAISDEGAKQLPEICRRFRKTYLWSLREFTDHPQVLEKELATLLHHSKTYVPPYNAILISLFTESGALTQAIEARAKIEKKLKVKWRYGEAAFQRMKTGTCEKEFLSQSQYDEICLGKDLAFHRIRELNEVSK